VWCGAWCGAWCARVVCGVLSSGFYIFPFLDFICFVACGSTLEGDGGDHGKYPWRTIYYFASSNFILLVYHKYGAPTVIPNIEATQGGTTASSPCLRSVSGSNLSLAHY
jgi:hypothetical protein